ncbi:hypothetical protein ABZ897_51030 [Nonomuraea sp. NPDC046802]|uniref:hypothetical protein n=1 Tax=Nonomuraea sp. NPDC046802 TaxID=3154919 RepID=UPI00340E7839
MRNHVSYTPATAPAPIITIAPGKPRVLLSGIVFGWWGRCAHCHALVDLYIDNGQILIELETSGGEARWSRQHLVSRPAVPHECPKCGKAQWHTAGAFEKPTPDSPGYVSDAVKKALDAVFDRLREDYPEQAKVADEQRRPNEPAYETVVMG